MLNAKEIKMLNEALNIKIAAIKRAANTEKSEAVKSIREEEGHEYSALQMKINSKGLFDEPQISKQK